MRLDVIRQSVLPTDLTQPPGCLMDVQHVLPAQLPQGTQLSFPLERAASPVSMT